MGITEEKEQPSGPVEFLNRAAFVIGSIIAAVVVYFGTAGVLSLEMVSK